MKAIVLTIVLATGQWGFLGFAEPDVRNPLPMTYNTARSFCAQTGSDVLLVVHRAGQEYLPRELATAHPRVAFQCYDANPVIWRSIYKPSLPCLVMIYRDGDRTYFDIPKRPPLNAYAPAEVIKSWRDGESVPAKWLLPLTREVRTIERQIVQNPPVQRYIPIRMHSSYGASPIYSVRSMGVCVGGS